MVRIITGLGVLSSMLKILCRRRLMAWRRLLGLWICLLKLALEARDLSALLSYRVHARR